MMDEFCYKAGEAYCEGVSLAEIAEKVGTPAYVYSGATLDRHCKRFLEGFREYPTLACYAVKANSNLSVLKKIAGLGYGADVVSGGELQRALVAGLSSKKIVFSGVGKTEDEIELGLQKDIYAFNVESLGELQKIGEIAQRLQKTAPISLRVNPNVDPKTNPYIATGLRGAKFGVLEESLPDFFSLLSKYEQIRLMGLSCHIGSQIVEMTPFREAAERMAFLASEVAAKGFPIEFIDMGGGLGICYSDEQPPSIEVYAKTLLESVAPTQLRLLVEPGRVLVGNVGILLSRVLYTKETKTKNFLIIDGAMNDLLRPSLYRAFHRVEPALEKASRREWVADVVGPICESGDFFAQGRTLPRMDPGELVMVRSCGAYAATMASNYNSRPRAPEVLVEGDHFKVVRRRESMDSLWANEL